MLKIAILQNTFFSMTDFIQCFVTYFVQKVDFAALTSLDYYLCACVFLVITCVLIITGVLITCIITCN